MLRKKTADINIQEWLDRVQELVGTIRELKYQSKSGVAGNIEIVSFTPYAEPIIGYGSWHKNIENDTPQDIKLGVYEIRFIDTEKYRNKVIGFEVEAYFSDYHGYSESLYISNKRQDTGKRLQAYEFGFIDYVKEGA